ncbi:MAG: Cysteine desulfurase [Candidatus Fermentimicrarchaeum limneticum]|uniref:Cysteine desulfurase IscS n=1 Tax=Fermentimicrarchaeum limneticum TaxID=2795018 RepID=A0A7D6BAR0_FERL1|nr:MAG: Cysteine desulfurase [Candidatus Fermentimicrarchaeum limneticum]
MRRVYLDHSATTPLDRGVFEEMKPYFSKKFGNASSLHSFGREASEAVEEAREKVANVLKCKPSEVFFTSGGTEADNWAVKGTAFANWKKGRHIITSSIEHHAILYTCEYLEKNGFEVTYLPVDRYGLVKPADVEDAIRKDTILISIMHANNEIGTIEPIGEIGKIARENEIYFHSDGVQSFCKIPTDVNKLNVDMFSISAHKFYGPKGVGALFIRSGTKIEPLLHGGGHEKGMRSGTENTPGIVGLGAASELGLKRMEKDAEKMISLRDRLIKDVLKINGSWLNGHPVKRLPNNAHFCFSLIEGESLILYLDEKGIAASTGSACSSKSLEPSHVLLRIGLRHEEAHGSLRLTLGRENRKDEIDYVIKVIPKEVERLRAISPFKTKKQLSSFKSTEED